MPMMFWCIHPRMLATVVSNRRKGAKNHFMFEGDNSRKETSMKLKVINGIFALALVVGVVALTLSLSAGASVSTA